MVAEGLVADKKKQKQVFGLKEWTQFSITFGTISDTILCINATELRFPFLPQSSVGLTQRRVHFFSAGGIKTEDVFNTA